MLLYSYIILEIPTSIGNGLPKPGNDGNSQQSPTFPSGPGNYQGIPAYIPVPAYSNAYYVTPVYYQGQFIQQTHPGFPGGQGGFPGGQGGQGGYPGSQGGQGGYPGGQGGYPGGQGGYPGGQGGQGGYPGSQGGYPGSQGGYPGGQGGFSGGQGGYPGGQGFPSNQQINFNGPIQNSGPSEQIQIKFSETLKSPELSNASSNSLQSEIPAPQTKVNPYPGFEGMKFVAPKDTNVQKVDPDVEEFNLRMERLKNGL